MRFRCCCNTHDGNGSRNRLPSFLYNTNKQTAQYIIYIHLLYKTYNMSGTKNKMITITMDVEERLIKIAKINNRSLKSEMERAVEQYADKVLPKKKIVCCAIWYNDNKKHEHQPKGVEIGFVIQGRTHKDCSIELIDQMNYYQSGIVLKESGFIDSEGCYHNRTEAAKIAFAAGQLTRLTEKLYIEDLC